MSSTDRDFAEEKDVASVGYDAGRGVPLKELAADCLREADDESLIK